MTVVILGPYGSGKSTLIRRIMKPREWVKHYRSGILPWSYTCEELTVFGQYERNTRTRHGMVMFERDPMAFDLVLQHAIESGRPGVMEGGFTRTERLRAGSGPTFAKTAHVIYLDVVGEPKDRLGRKLTDNSLDDYEFKMMRTTAAFRELGAVVELIEDRQRALVRVCELLNITAPTEPIEEDYR